MAFASDRNGLGGANSQRDAKHGMPHRLAVDHGRCAGLAPSVGGAQEYAYAMSSVIEPQGNDVAVLLYDLPWGLYVYVRSCAP